MHTPVPTALKVHTMDSGIGNITAALRQRQMWSTTLIVMSSDNGGREDKEFGGNNWPLRGMKFSDFEGGVRVAAFASGGVIPKARRGAVEPGLMHITDWYCTFSLFAGVNPIDTKAIGSPVPPVDCLDMWPTIATGSPSPRTDITLSTDAHIQWPFKLVLGKQRGKGVWTGIRHPNATRLTNDDAGCGNGQPGTPGCLFNIAEDPTEHVDLATSLPGIVANISAALNAAVTTQFQTGHDHYYGIYTNCTTLAEFVEKYPGFGGPLCYAVTAQ